MTNFTKNIRVVAVLAFLLGGCAQTANLEGTTFKGGGGLTLADLPPDGLSFNVKAIRDFTLCDNATAICNDGKAQRIMITGHISRGGIFTDYAQVAGSSKFEILSEKPLNPDGYDKFDGYVDGGFYIGLRSDGIKGIYRINIGDGNCRFETQVTAPRKTITDRITTSVCDIYEGDAFRKYVAG